MDQEKRGPIEKGEKGWPINPFGVVALLVFALIIIFLIVKPLAQKKAPSLQEQGNASGGHLISPSAGQIVKAGDMSIELSADEPAKTQKVQFWAKTYADGNWQMIGEATSAPYKLDWKIPDNFKDKAIAITAHIFTNEGREIKDPGGWREGIIILSN